MWPFKAKPELTETLDALRKTIDDLAISAAAAGAAASKAAQSAEDVRSSLASLSRSGEPHRRRFWLFTGFCIVSLIGGILLTLTAVKAFSDPLPRGSNDGTIAVAVQLDEKVHGLGESSLGLIGISQVFAVTEQSDMVDVSLDIVLPASSIGRNMVVELWGSAMLTSAQLPPGMAISSAKCQGYHEFSFAAAGSYPCQIVKGVVSSTTNGYWVGACREELLAGGKQLGLVSIRGRSSLTETQPDWAHTMITLPSSTTMGSSRLADSWEVDGLSGIYSYPISQKVCRRLSSAAGESLTAAQNPGKADGGDFIWSENGDSSSTMMFRRNDAGSRGNIILASGAACVALAVGLLPIAEESRRGWRRQGKLN